MTTNEEISDAIRKAAGRIPNPERDESASPDGGNVFLGSADGGAGTGSGPRLSAGEMMNRAIRAAWGRRRGRL